MSTINWDDLESSFQKEYRKTKNQFAKVRQSLLNRKIDQATEQLEEILRQSPNNIEAQNLLMHCLREKGESQDEVMKTLNETLKLDPTNVLTNYHLGELHYNKKDYTKALEHYQRAHQALPQNARILYQIGLTYQKMKNYQLSSQAYEQSIAIDPKYSKPYVNACILFDKMDDHLKMVKVMGTLSTDFAQSSKALNVLNVLYNNFPEKNDAIEKNFAHISSIDPNNMLNLYNQAIYSHAHNDIEKSLQLFARILENPVLKASKTHPIKIFSEAHIALILERQTQLKTARKHLINVSDNLHGFITPTDVNNKIKELQKLLVKRRTSHRSSFMTVDGDLMGLNNLMNVDSELANRDLTSDANTTFSEMKSSALHLSKRNSRLQGVKPIAKNWDLETCLKHLQDDPNNFEANLRCGAIHLEERDLNNAKERLAKCQEIDPDKENDKINILLAEINRLEKNYDEASNCLDKIMNIEENIEALTVKAAIEEKLGRVDQAKSLYIDALNIQDEYPPLYTRYGWFLIKIGNVDEGTAYLSRGYSLDPNNLKINKKLGRAYLLSEESKIDDAFKHFNFVYEKKNDDYIGLLGLGQAYERKQDYEKALEFLQKAAELPKADLNCQFFLGTVYSKLRHYKKAQEIFRAVLRQDPNHVEACVEIATIFTLLKEYEKARRYYKHAIKNSPENIIANLRYGKICQVYLKDYEAAMECYQRILTVDSNHCKSYYQIGLIQYEQKKINEAHENFKNAVKANPKYAPAWKAIGILLFENNKVESALKYFEKADSFEPKDVENKIYIGNCHYELQNNEEAIIVYLEVLQLEESADIHYNLANSYYMKNALDEAIEHYGKSLHLNAGKAECWYNLGNAYCMKGAYEDAVKNFRKSVEIDTQNVAAFYNLGNAYLLLKDLKNAIEAFEEAIKLDPENTEWKLMLAGVHLETGGYQQVFNLVKEVLAKAPNNLDAMMLLVQSYEGKEEYQEALTTAKKIQLMNPKYEGIQAKVAALSEKITK